MKRPSLKERRFLEKAAEHAAQIHTGKEVEAAWALKLMDEVFQRQVKRGVIV